MDAIELDLIDVKAKKKIDDLTKNFERKFRGERQRRRQIVGDQFQQVKDALRQSIPLDQPPSEQPLSNQPPPEVNYGLEE